MKERKNIFLLLLFHFHIHSSKNFVFHFILICISWPIPYTYTYTYMDSFCRWGKEKLLSSFSSSSQQKFVWIWDLWIRKRNKVCWGILIGYYYYYLPYWTISKGGKQKSSGRVSVSRLKLIESLRALTETRALRIVNPWVNCGSDHVITIWALSRVSCVSLWPLLSLSINDKLFRTQYSKLQM